MFGGAAFGHALMAAKREFAVHPAEAGGAGDKYVGEMSAEESVTLIDALEDFEGAFRVGGWCAEFLELLMGPIHEQDLAIELVLSRSDDVVEFVALAQFSQLGIIKRVTVEAFGVVA